MIFDINGTQSMNDLVEKILSGHFTRTSLLRLRENAVTRLGTKPEDERAKEVKEIIDSTQLPTLMKEYVFMGFMPGADSDRAIDDKWYSDGICTFDWYADTKQTEHFYKILSGDILITKKMLISSTQMEIYAHGDVVETVDSPASNQRWLKVDWHHPKEFLVVPLIGCTRTVNPRSSEVVEEKMPDEFWEWIKEGRS